MVLPRYPAGVSGYGKIVQLELDGRKLARQGAGNYHLVCFKPLLTLTQALKENPDKYKEQLQSRFEERALNETSSALKLQTQPQILTTVYNYLNESEWNEWRPCRSKGPSDTMPLIARRLKACGLKSLKETTKKHCIAVVLHCMLQRGEVRPPSTELYQLVCYFQDTFHACTQPPLTASLSHKANGPGRRVRPETIHKRRWVCCRRQRSAIECVQFEERALNETSSALKLQTQPQILTTVYNYLNESEWKTVQGKGPSDTMPLIARRLKACGLKISQGNYQETLHCSSSPLHVAER